MQLRIITAAWILIILISISCGNLKEESNMNSFSSEKESSVLFLTTMEKHLESVSSRDLETLKSTLSPEGKMQLILPDSEIMNTSESFIKFHEEWFLDTTWTYKAKILNTEIGEKLGIAIAEILYKEPNRNGKPYFNRMIVSYALEKVNGQWYIIKDHASSIERSSTE